MALVRPSLDLESSGQKHANYGHESEMTLFSECTLYRARNCWIRPENVREVML